MLYKSNIKAARKMKREGALLKERERILRELGGLEELRRGSVVAQYFPRPRRGKEVKTVRGLYPLFSCKRGGRAVGFRIHLEAELRSRERQVGDFHRFRRLCQRLVEKVKVAGESSPGLLSRTGLSPGRVVDLGWVRLRPDGAGVLGVWAKGPREGWWVATNLAVSVREVASLYDRRMGIEEQIRDTKGSRFGIKLFWTQIRRPESLARLTLLAGIALRRLRNFAWIDRPEGGKKSVSRSGF